MDFIHALLRESKQITQLLEARKNPNRNPKSSAVDAIRKYVAENGIENSFVHFTKIPKLGINPQTEWTGSTPAGVFSYPAQYVLDVYKQSGDFSELPYGSEFEYLYVFTATGNIVDLNSVSADEVDKFISQLRQFVDKNNPRIARLFNDVYSTPGEQLYKTVTAVSRIESVTSSGSPHLISRKLFIKLGIDGLLDSQGIIHSGETTQCVVFSTRNISNPKLVNTHSHSEMGSRKGEAERNKNLQSISSALPLSEFDRAIRYPAVSIPKITNPVTREKIIREYPQLIKHFTVLSSSEAEIAIMSADPAKKWQTVLLVLAKLKKVTESIALLIVKNSKPIEVSRSINRIVEKRIPVDAGGYSVLLAANFEEARKIPQQLNQRVLLKAVEYSKELNPKSTEKINRLLN